jgi:hypothetical protein
MKTLHRLMYENLTPEEYKVFCRIPPSAMLGGVMYLDHTNSLPSKALTWCISFVYVEDVLNLPSAYFREIYLNLMEQGK